MDRKRNMTEPPPITVLLGEQILTRQRIERLGQIRLSPELRMLLWFLRGYVLFMFGVVAWELWKTFHLYARWALCPSSDYPVTKFGS